eukprot:CAMPEP_0184493158 /NCGR_PEP_ID=MMETSP0113_2-20130426/25244_1 /TAXON_ID=91329 /ORGANISM="Norrisiella sphaerica, Strain BC52" /LENGTH=68 /DNA_ID=CAMNT_0026878313 /DNA_START=149 /DNA_END=351 /DNA_ORIENTATION=-
MLTDLQYNKNNRLHWTEIAEYMSKRGVSNWLQPEQVTEMGERLNALVGKDQQTMKLEDVEKLLLDYLP